MVKTLCPIRDIKGWRKYYHCPYAKSLYIKPGVSDALRTSGRKERFFRTLQENVGREGYLTKEKMKKTLGEFKSELSSNDFYKLCTSIFPDEKQRFTMSSAGKEISANSRAEAGSAQKTSTTNVPAPEKIQNMAGKEKRPLQLRTVSPQRFFPRERIDEKKDDPKGSGFFRAIRTTIGKN
ncbi:MAG: hypothetical protein A3J76_02970 [Candidatus Moranbacteria bacterium RBG_13_45_13]|nr:MAG: hypothetical protein A3J76_02970 [Candidatus Moranbacteria bacterium RBG_13_45_13]